MIFTPGHTPGHISLYLKESKTLVAGDSMVIKNGLLQGPVPQNTPDMDIAIKSLEKYLDLDIENVICYHGGLCNLNVKDQIQRLVKQNN